MRAVSRVTARETALKVANVVEQATGIRSADFDRPRRRRSSWDI
jgi:hypothetical protein